MQYAVIDIDENGKTWESFGPFRGRKEATTWKDKTFEQVLGLAGARRVKGTLKVVRLHSREELGKEIAVVERRAWRGNRFVGMQ